MIGARGTDGKRPAPGTVPGPERSEGPGAVPGSALAKRADLLLLAVLLGTGLCLCGARALGRRAALEAAGPAPDPEAVAHRVDLAAAGEAELQLLPGVGPRLARVIASERAAAGPFASLEEMDRRVPGVGPARVRWWKGRVELPPQEDAK